MSAAGMNARLMKLGIPVVFQNIIIGVGGLVVQYVINGYGFLFVAGFTATNKLYGLLEMAAISYGYAIVTYVGQNLGAGKIDRIRKGVRSSMLLSLLTSLIISAAMFLFGKNILLLFISGEPQQTQEVLAIAFKYLSIMAAMLWVVLPVCVQICTAGTGRYVNAYGKWYGRICHAYQCCADSSPFYRAGRYFLCGDCSMERSYCDFMYQLLCADA